MMRFLVDDAPEDGTQSFTEQCLGTYAAAHCLSRVSLRNGDTASDKAEDLQAAQISSAPATTFATASAAVRVRARLKRNSGPVAPQFDSRALRVFPFPITTPTTANDTTAASALLCPIPFSRHHARPPTARISPDSAATRPPPPPGHPEGHPRARLRPPRPLMIHRYASRHLSRPSGAVSRVEMAV